MDIVVGGKTVSVNLPDLKDIGKPKGHGTDFAQLLAEQNTVKEEIKEKGFGKYAADMQQEKLEKEIREKVLAALGLSEDQLASLPAGQRALIEKTIQETIAQEVQAKMEEGMQENKDKNTVTVPLIAGLSV